MRGRFINTLAGLIVVILFLGNAYAGRLVVVFGIDETGSYSFRKKAISIARYVISKLRPGDVLYARRITDNSYDDSCSIFRLELPEIGPRPRNRFDRRAWQNWKKKRRAVLVLKIRAMNALLRLPPLNARRTDIWGFLAAASDRFRAEGGKDDCRMIIIASDMKDNCHREIKIDLFGAKVLIAGFESGEDPGLTRKIKARWTRAFRRYNATSVVFLPPECKLSINRYR